MYSPKAKVKVYCEKCWWGDGWHLTSYGMDYDFSRPFIEQWQELLSKVPLIHTWKFNNVSSDYINYATEDKNCYLSYSVVCCENVAYSYSIDKSRDTLDSSFAKKCDWCYENIDSQNNYNSIFLKDCSDCIDSGFLYDCANCQNCYLSSNLRNKKYFFRNKQLSKSEYELKIAELELNKSSLLRKLIFEFNDNLKKNVIHKFARITNGIQCSGNNIENTRNAKHSFNVYNSENQRYVGRTGLSKDCMDVYGNIEADLTYESVAPTFRGSNTSFSMSNQTSHDIQYSFLSSASSHLFGCISLRSKSHCILNRQYTKEEYEELVPKIIKHMNDMPYIDNKGRVYRYGEFFPPELSPFSYNETIAQEYFPLTKEEALKQGYKWKEKETRNYKIDIKNEDIPDDIKEVREDIVNKVIECAHSTGSNKGECNEQCTEAFKIVPDELSFYQRMNLPLPRLCPNCRHYNRLKQRNPLKLWHRHCMKPGCPNEFETSYAPERPEIVYCETCYNAEVY